MENRISIDDLLGQLYGETTARFDDRIIGIERELMRRRLLSAERRTNLFAQLEELNEEIMRLMPEGEHSIDVHRSMRQALERERRELQREFDEELIERWRDLQPLRRELRELLEQQRATIDRYHFTTRYD